jgi:hypothetical protein
MGCMIEEWIGGNANGRKSGTRGQKFEYHNQDGNISKLEEKERKKGKNKKLWLTRRDTGVIGTFGYARCDNFLGTLQGSRARATNAIYPAFEPLPPSDLPVAPLDMSILGLIVWRRASRCVFTTKRRFYSQSTLPSNTYDVVCVGGGPAGLSLLAALRKILYTQCFECNSPFQVHRQQLRG